MEKRFKDKAIPPPAARSPAAARALAKLKEGFFLHQKGQLTQAQELYRRALNLHPMNSDALHLLGVIAYQTQRPAEAVEYIGRATKINPNNADFYNNYGLALQKLERFDQALDSYDCALGLQTDNAATHNNRGNTLKGLRQLNEALKSYDHAIKLNPDYAEAYNNRALTLNELKRFDEALENYDRALKLKPDYAETYYNRGNLLKGLMRLDEALESYARALKLKPDYAECHRNVSICNLSMGDFARGWEKFRWRLNLERSDTTDVHHFHRRPLPADLTGQHVVVVREQGLGDELFFLRFATALQTRGAHVTYLADPRLVAMLDRANILDRVLPSDTDPGPFDLRLTVGDLPWLLGADETNIPPPFPIPPLAERQMKLSKRLQAFGPPPYVGITWRAGIKEFGSHFKEIPFSRLAEAICPLGGSPIVVQRLPEVGEVAALEGVFGKTVLDLSALNDDLEDMLALMGLFEFYVCVSNTNLHLRSANGHASHVLVPNPLSDFRWMSEGEESPWYPDTRVYRWQAANDWSHALDKLGRDLRCDSSQGFP